jgi:isopentenyl-diphosphate Delta-isomerase
VSANPEARESDEVVVLVDERDVPLGIASKLAAHRDGRLHRAVSVMLFDDNGQLLLQQRAAGKYHSAGRWSNACCGHPRPGETTGDAARRRLRDELGIEGCQLEHVSEFVYTADLGDGLIEHELDHVFVGRWSGALRPDPTEVAATRWVRRDDLEVDLARAPERYTAWLANVVDHACRARFEPQPGA